MSKFTFKRTNTDTDSDWAVYDVYEGETKLGTISKTHAGFYKGYYGWRISNTRAPEYGYRDLVRNTRQEAAEWLKENRAGL